MDKHPPLYDYTSIPCPVFLECLKILGFSFPNPSVLENCERVEDIIQQGLETNHSDHSIGVKIGRFYLSFIRFHQEMVVKNNSPLHLVCEMGDLDKVKAICVTSHIDVSNKDGDTPLHVACRHGHRDICEYLVSEMVHKCGKELQCLRIPDNKYVKDILIDFPSYNRDSFLYYLFYIAGIYFSDMTHRERLQKAKHKNVIVCNHIPSLFSLNNANELPVHLALKCSNQSCLECFKNVPDTLMIVSYPNQKDERVVFVHQNVRDFRSRYSQTSQYDKYFEEYRTILHYHSDSRFKEMIDARLTVHSQHIYDLLKVEAFYFYYKDVLDVVEYIHSDFPLHYLIEHYYSTFLLVSRNIDSSNLIDEAWSKYYSQTDINGNLPLHLLCERYNDMNNNALLGIFSQCELNLKNIQGLTPFEVAFNKHNYITCIWLMLRKQCDVYLYGTKIETQRCEAIETLTKQIFEDTHITSFSPSNVVAGDTLLHVALKYGTEEAIDYLIHKVDIRESKLNSRQEYPIHVACRQGHPSSILKLLTDCNLEQHNVDGNTPFDVLCKDHPHGYDLMLCLVNFPSFPSKYSNSTEIVIAKRFQEIEKSRLTELCTNSNNALHVAVALGDMETINFLRDHYSDIFSKFISSRNELEELPFHMAGQHPKMEGLGLLFGGGDPNVVDRLGNSVLHLVCLYSANKESDVEVLRFLVKELKCKPQLCNEHGKTPLHIACRQGSLKLVKYLLDEVKVDPNIKDKNNCTPLMVTYHYEHDIIKELIQSDAQTSQLYGAYKDIFVKYSSDNPPPTPLNIIVVGKPSSGKTTIIKALKNENGCEMVLPEEHTAGIIPSSFDSKSFGCTAWYDLAGQSEYYASHEAVLCNLMSSSSPLILLLVDCRKNQEFIYQDILYWLQFLKSQMPPKQANLKPHIAIIFSFADKLPLHVIEEKISCCRKDMTPFFQKSGFKFVQTAALDCRIPNSDKIGSVRHQILASATEIRVSLPINFVLYCFYAFLLHKFHLKPAVTIEDVLYHKDEWLSLDIDRDDDSDDESGSDDSSHSDELSDYEDDLMFEEESVRVLLDDNEKALKVSKKLHKTGHIILVQDRDRIRRSWLIINKDILLDEVHGTLFAPPHFRQHYENLCTSTGVVASSIIARRFPQYEVTMLIGFLVHLEFCQEIKDKNILSLLSSDSNYTREDEYFYFPGLVRIEKPDGVWGISGQQSNQCCWLLQTADAHTFFTPRFVQILLLRIAFSYPFAVTNRRIGIPSLTLCRACCVWKNGIFWRTDIGIECLLEITEECQAVVLMFRSTDSELSSEDLASFSYLRSSLISKLLSTTQELCPALNVSEYLCHPEYMQYPIKLCREMALYSIKSVARAMCQKSKVVLCDNPQFQSIRLIELVLFEPLSSFCIGRLFNDSFQDQIVSADDLDFISTVTSSGQFCASYYYIFRTKGCSLHTSEIQSENVRELLKSRKKLSYKTLRSLIGKFSIFGNRDPQVNIQECLIYFLSL